MKELVTDATVENVTQVIDFVDKELKSNNCSMKVQTEIDIAVDEVFANIVNYAYTPNVGKATIRIEVDPHKAIITFIDSGIPFDPLKNKEPNVNAKLEDRAIGGLGIYIVKKSMDAVEYERKEGKNILTIKKNI